MISSLTMFYLMLSGFGMDIHISGTSENQVVQQLVNFFGPVCSTTCQFLRSCLFNNLSLSSVLFVQQLCQFLRSCLFNNLSISSVMFVQLLVNFFGHVCLTTCQFIRSCLFNNLSISSVKFVQQLVNFFGHVCSTTCQFLRSCLCLILKVALY